MKLLLDTHALLWWLGDNPRLGSRTRAAIADSRESVLVSVVSGWELSIKYRTGKIQNAGSAVLREAAACGFTILAVEQRHLALLETFKHLPKHNDPFDHMILVQAKAEGAALVTSDRQMRRYDIPVLGFARTDKH